VKLTGEQLSTLANHICDETLATVQTILADKRKAAAVPGFVMPPTPLDPATVAVAVTQGVLSALLALKLIEVEG
jgi:hypothetical protein